MAEWADARDLKSCGGHLRVGSSPTPGILQTTRRRDAMLFVRRNFDGRAFSLGKKDDYRKTVPVHPLRP